jgi:hypothetical protein
MLATKKLRMVKLKRLSRRELNRRLDNQKSRRRKQSEKLLTVPDDELAQVRIQQHTATIGELKQVREMLPHPVHRFLVVSSSRQGRMLYGFCRDSGCRLRVFKSSTVTVPGLSIKDWFPASQGGCTHPFVSLKRAKNFDISAVCVTCRQTSVVQNVFVESRHLLWPKVDWPNLSMLGDSMLPKGDPRLL